MKEMSNVSAVASMAKEDDELPDGWAKAPIGQLIELNPKTNLQDDDEVGFVPMALIGTGFLEAVRYETKLWKEVRKGYTHFQDGDVLVAKITPCFENGKGALVSGLPNGAGAGSTEYFVCRPRKDVLNAKYLHAFFKTPSFMAEAETHMSGSVGHKRVPKEQVVATELPLAPLAEQKRIADKLEAVLGRVYACRARLDRVPDLLKRFRQSVLAAASSGQLTEDWRSRQPKRKGASSDQPQMFEDEVASPFESLPLGWKLKRSADAVEPGADIVYGIVQPGAKLTEGIPYIRGMDIENGRILINQLLRTSRAIADRYARSALKGGDILLGIIRATKVARVPDELEGANITQGTARFRPSSELRSKFLAVVLESPSVQRWLHAHYRGIDMPGLNLSDVRRIPIPIPPMDEQDEIVRRAEALLDFADRIETRLSAARSQVERLTPATLCKAFRGDLVPQDPTDESANALLERLRAKLAIQTAMPKRAQPPYKPVMKKTSYESVQDAILNLPRKFSFADLRQQVQVDYDTLQHTVFRLLAEPKPILKQEFNSKAKIMIFQRLKP